MLSSAGWGTRPWRKHQPTWRSRTLARRKQWRASTRSGPLLKLPSKSCKQLAKRIQKLGWEAGIRTPITWSRATCPTVERPPSRVSRQGENPTNLTVRRAPRQATRTRRRLATVRAMPDSFKDHFSARAADYALYRPSYPAGLAPYLAGLAPGRRLALDCGCGTGQFSVLLAAEFDRVVAIDASPEQIGHARPGPRVDYRVARAEATG